MRPFEPLCCSGAAGFTGADLQNLMNEAAILAARRNLKEISKEEISDALERIVAGPEKKGAVMTEAKKRLVAYHEVRPQLVHPHFAFAHVHSEQAMGRSLMACPTGVKLTILSWSCMLRACHEGSS